MSISFAKLSISQCMALANFASILLISISVLIVIGEILFQDLERQAIDRQKLCMKIARSTLQEKGADVSVVDGKLRAGIIVLNETYAVVDTIKKLTGGTSDKGTRLQFPMDGQHLSEMAEILSRLAHKAA